MSFLRFYISSPNSSCLAMILLTFETLDFFIGAGSSSESESSHSCFFSYKDSLSFNFLSLSFLSDVGLSFLLEFYSYTRAFDLFLILSTCVSSCFICSSSYFILDFMATVCFSNSCWRMFSWSIYDFSTSTGLCSTVGSSSILITPLVVTEGGLS
jgi:hypothetical protein